MTNGHDPRLQNVLDALWASADRLDVNPMPGGITNRNYKVDADGLSFVVRLPGKDTEILGINRAAEFRAAQMAAAAGVGPEVVAFLPEHASLVTRFVEAEPIPEERIGREPDLTRAVRAIRAFHAVGSIPASFDSFRVVEVYRDEAAARGIVVPKEFERLHEVAGRIEAALLVTPRSLAPCHNDLLNANFLRHGDRVVIVDYEYAGMGDVFFDLANFSVNNGLGEDAQTRVLEIAFGPVTPLFSARLGLMRLMSDFREAMWGVVQQGISTLDFDYVAYAAKHFDRGLANAADPRFESWLGDAAGG